MENTARYDLQAHTEATSIPETITFGFLIVKKQLYLTHTVLNISKLKN